MRLRVRLVVGLLDWSARAVSRAGPRQRRRANLRRRQFLDRLGRFPAPSDACPQAGPSGRPRGSRRLLFDSLLCCACVKDCHDRGAEVGRRRVIRRLCHGRATLQLGLGFRTGSYAPGWRQARSRARVRSAGPWRTGCHPEHPRRDHVATTCPWSSTTRRGEDLLQAARTCCHVHGIGQLEERNFAGKARRWYQTALARMPVGVAGRESSRSPVVHLRARQLRTRPKGSYYDRRRVREDLRWACAPERRLSKSSTTILDDAITHAAAVLGRAGRATETTLTPARPALIPHRLFGQATSRTRHDQA